MKFDLDVRWIQSGQWVTFQSREGEKFGPHMDNYSRSHLSPPGSTGVGELKFQAFSSSPWMGYFEGYIAMLCKCSRD